MALILGQSDFNILLPLDKLGLYVSTGGNFHIKSIFGLVFVSIVLAFGFAIMGFDLVSILFALVVNDTSPIFAFVERYTHKKIQAHLLPHIELFSLVKAKA